MVSDALGTWPAHSGGPPERLVTAIQQGHEALRERSRSPITTHGEDDGTVCSLDGPLETMDEELAEELAAGAVGCPSGHPAAAA